MSTKLTEPFFCSHLQRPAAWWSHGHRLWEAAPSSLSEFWSCRGSSCRCGCKREQRLIATCQVSRALLRLSVLRYHEKDDFWEGSHNVIRYSGAVCPMCISCWCRHRALSSGSKQWQKVTHFHPQQQEKRVFVIKKSARYTSLFWIFRGRYKIINSLFEDRGLYEDNSIRMKASPWWKPLEWQKWVSKHFQKTPLSSPGHAPVVQEGGLQIPQPLCSRRKFWHSCKCWHNI